METTHIPSTTQRAANIRTQAIELEQDSERLLRRAATVQEAVPGLAADLAARAAKLERKAAKLRDTAAKLLSTDGLTVHAPTG